MRSVFSKMRDAAGTPFGLMVVDFQMPDIDGFMLVERVQKLPELDGLITVMLTSGGQRGDAVRCKDLGIAAYLIKPVLQSDLLEALLNVLGSRKGVAATRQTGDTPYSSRGTDAAAHTC